ncbi:histidine--tRNA ligase [bacterium]|nr:histidine--tRNA ligase [bacterium]MDB2447187.1 histidine--tRNA ligase [bacterium]
MAKQKKLKPVKLKGFQDYTPEVMKKRYEIMDAVRATSEASGFQMVGTPALEYAETLLGEGGETDKQVYKFEDNGGREVALRFDLTVPFARYASENFGSYPLPFKRAQIGNVWRAEKPQKGRYREFCQCDFDVIGVDSKFADLEVVLALSRTLSNLNFGSYTVSFGHRLILGGLLKHFLPDLMASQEGEKEALIAIDKLDKIGPEKVQVLLCKLEGVTEAGASDLMKVIMDGSSSETLSKIAELLSNDEEAREAVERTSFVVNEVNKFLEGKPGKAVIDLKIARGLAYYTGIVFETTMDDLPGFGSICSGGRYNNLCDRFSSRELPGVGGSIGLDRLIAGLSELNQISNDKRSGVYIIVASEEARSYALEICHQLRDAGIASDIDLKGQKMNKQFQAADKLSRAYAIAIGSNELEQKASRTVGLKDLNTGEQEALTIEDIVSKLRT